MTLNDNLKEYILDPHDGLKNFNLGVSYDEIGQLASAYSYYLRTSEYSYDIDLIYESIIKAAHCLRTIGRRDHSEKGLYYHAISYQPQRPEAYFSLSQYYERHKQWQSSYAMSCIGLSNIDNSKDTRTKIDYHGEYGFIFNKAVSSWWMGLNKQSRTLFHELANNHINDMDELYKNLTQQNITSLGSGPNPFIQYTSDLHDKLKYDFPGSKFIKRNFSQTYQDMFVLTMLNGKTNGTYLEIGAADPFKGSNTALLEKQFDWKGMSVEILEEEVIKFRQQRTNLIHHGNALDIDYNKFIKDTGFNNNIDYLQIDCEPPAVSYEILTKIPFDKYKFAVITFEHDYYADITKSYRDKSREFLFSKGYSLLASDIAPDSTSSFEDWWIHPELVSKDIVNKMVDLRKGTKNAQEYMFKKTFY
jgi:hypothetical protein